MKFTRMLLLAMAVMPSTMVLAWHPVSRQGLPKSAASMSAVYPVYPKIAYGQGAQARLIKRGEYLARAGDCIACHTDTTQKNPQPFAGGLPLKTPFGTFYSPNITPDKQTGLGNWRLADFQRAMHHGKNPQGKNYFPVFPYIYYTLISREDNAAIWAYLRAIPAVNKVNKTHDVPFPFSWRFAQYGWKMLFYYPYDGYYRYNPERSAQWNRGKYLVDGLGHCGMCHTPLNPLGAPKRAYYLTGGFIDGFWAPNITALGLQSASKYQVSEVFKNNELLNQAGPVAGPMAAVNHDSLQYLSDQDLQAIATYLKTVESKQPLGVKNPYHGAPTLARGRKVYTSACIVCHQNGAAGAPVIGDAANWYKRVRGKGIHVLYRHTINGYNNMPIRGACVTCNDADIEAGVDYILHESLTDAQRQALASPQRLPKPSLADGKKIYQQYCAVCHDKGHQGAPKIGDIKAWQPILDKNFDELVTNTIKGGSRKPPRGGCKYCTTAEIIAAVKYLAQQSSEKNDYRLW